MSVASLTNLNISDTYQGVLHAGGVPFAASGLQDIYDGYGNTSSLKLGRACEGASICGTLSADALSVVDPTILFNQLIKLIYPIDSIYLSLTPTAPFPGSGTTWVQASSGRVITGVGTVTDAGSYSKTISVGNNDGKYGITSNDLPQHFHYVFNNDDTGATDPPITADNYAAREAGLNVSFLAYRIEGTSTVATLGKTSPTGSSATSDFAPPSYGVYVWKRTA